MSSTADRSPALPARPSRIGAILLALSVAVVSLVLVLPLLLKGVLPELRDTGLDGIEALTPPPLGDTPIGLAREQLGPDITLIGGLDPTQFVGATPAKTRGMVRDCVAQMGDGRRMVLGHEEVHIKADLESVRVIPELLEEYATFGA